MRKANQTWKKQANPNPDVAKHVAGNAKKGQPNRKIAARLEARMADYSRFIGKVKNPAAFKRPGSMQK